MIWRLNLLALLVFLAAPVLAQEPLVFKPLASHDNMATIVRYLEFSGTAAQGAAIADVDLNGDGMSEALVTLNDKTTLILALTPRRAVVLLGTLPPAAGLEVLDTHDFGVRRIIAVGSPGDDFTRHPYHWNPYAKRYEAAR